MTCRALKLEGSIPPPPGMWKIIEQAPEPTAWWLLALDEDAKRYAASNGTSGCIIRTAHGLEPVDRIRL